MRQSETVIAKLPDSELFALVSNGNYPAFKEVYARYNSLLLSYAFRKLHDKDEAEDVVQDVFIQLWNKRDSLNIATSLSSYLYRAVLNKLLNVLRHKAINDRHVDQLQYFIRASSDNTDYRIREKDFSRLIENEIANLPPRTKEIFELRLKHYLTNREIAEKLGLSEHTVATQIKNALRVLRNKFGTYAILFYLISR
ncbi:hypothetical protein CKK33_04140 [Mucilaginibacter sp. MD40]|uniref:RNA polymerase sigma-70 factor n=1 Tax=Mucilaginibacter sp. MD40 TaxID=2029590 RepID=UPI000BACCD42|nr:RNA polymerase sigma-70 factor [Mucilaginibacter sp. MD40]PAW92728.1 hypothetical protein CKK33_04140 [Mucilaginibacter sp. MD40]